MFWDNPHCLRHLWVIIVLYFNKMSKTSDILPSFTDQFSITTGVQTFFKIYFIIKKQATGKATQAPSEIKLLPLLEDIPWAGVQSCRKSVGTGGSREWCVRSKGNMLEKHLITVTVWKATFSYVYEITGNCSMADNYNYQMKTQMIHLWQPTLAA